jgi:acetylxylan esterase
VLIYGQTPTDGACWDVSSNQTLTHDGGSDSTGLANMVRYALQKYNGDSSRVYVTGESSGAMMTVSSQTILLLCSIIAELLNSK